MLIFGNDQSMRGCFKEMMEMGSSGDQESRILGYGAYLTFQSENGEDVYPDPKRNSDAVEPYFINGIQFSQKEKYSIVQCFNEFNYIYAFGHDPTASLLEVSFMCFLVNSDGKSVGDSLNTLLKTYGDYRLSKSPKRVLLGLGNILLEGFLVGMTSATYDPTTNLQSFSATLLMTEANKGGTQAAASTPTTEEETQDTVSSNNSSASASVPALTDLPELGETPKLPDVRTQNFLRGRTR